VGVTLWGEEERVRQKNFVRTREKKTSFWEKKGERLRTSGNC